MSSPSTGKPLAPGQAAEPIVEAGATGSGATHTAVEGEPAARLPHERDQSTDSGTGPPRKLMEIAARDVKDGKVDPERGPQTELANSQLTQKSSPRGSVE